MVKAPCITSIVWCVCFFISCAAFASPLEVSIDPKSGTRGDLYSFKVSVDGANSSRPKLAPSDDWEVHYVGPRISVSITNSGRSFNTEYLFTLFPKRLGTLQTPKVEIESEGQRLVSDSLEVEVREGHGGGVANSDAWVTQSVDPKEVWQGQQSVYRCEIVTKTSLAQGSLDDLNIEGVWQEPLGQEEQTKRNISGGWADVFTTKKALFPSRSGEIVVPERALNAKIIKRKQLGLNFGLRGPFGDPQMLEDLFGIPELAPFRTTAPEIRLKVKPLPALPSDANIHGLSQPIVGETTVNVKVEPSTARVGDSISVVAEVTSVGNLAPLGKLNWLVDGHSFKVYDESPQTKSFENNEQLITRKRFSYSVVPLSTGEITIPSLRITYFDPATSSYKVTSASPVSLSIAPGVASAPVGQSSEPREEAQTPTAEIAEATETPSVVKDEGVELERYQHSKPRTSWVWLSFVSTTCVLLLCAFFSWVYLTRRNSLRRELIQLSQRANSVEDLTNVLHLFLKALDASTENSSRSLGELRSILVLRSLPSPLQLKIGKVIDDLEELTYGGKAPSSNLLSSLLTDMNTVIRETPPGFYRQNLRNKQSIT